MGRTIVQGGPLQMQHGRFGDCGLPGGAGAPIFFTESSLGTLANHQPKATTYPQPQWPPDQITTFEAG